MSDAYSPARLADRAEIQDVMYRWTRAVDRLDYDAIREVFHTDAIDNHGLYTGGVDGLIEWIRGRHRSVAMSMHIVANMLIEFTGPDSAVVETYNLTCQRYPAEGTAGLAALAGGASGKAGTATDLLAFARYVDRFERRDGRWKIAERTVVFDNTMMSEVPENGPKFGADWTVGRRDRQDFVYAERARGGLTS